jgi:filamentous hemagglutinin
MDEYETRADAFLGVPVTDTVLEAVRQDGRRCRFDPNTDEFEVIAADGHVVTFFRPDPLVHGHPTNLAYFQADSLR